MLAGGAHGTVWDDSRCAPRAFSRRCSRTRAPLMYSGPRRAGTDGQTSLRTGPAPAAPAGPNGGVLLLSVQNRPVAGRARNALRIVPDACMCCNVGHLGRFAASFARDRVCVSSQAHSPDVHTRGGGGAKLFCDFVRGGSHILQFQTNFDASSAYFSEELTDRLP